MKESFSDFLLRAKKNQNKQKNPPYTEEEINLYINHLIHWEIGVIITKLDSLSYFILKKNIKPIFLRQKMEKAKKKLIRKTKQTQNVPVLPIFSNPISWTDICSNLDLDPEDRDRLFAYLIQKGFIQEILQYISLHKLTDFSKIKEEFNKEELYYFNIIKNQIEENNGLLLVKEIGYNKNIKSDILKNIIEKFSKYFILYFE